MEKPKYTPPRAVELTTFLEGLHPLELRWLQGECSVVLDRKADEAHRQWEETSNARWARNLEWSASGVLKPAKSFDDEITPAVEDFAI